MSGYSGFKDISDSASEHGAHSFLIDQIINKLATTALVQVSTVTNAGGITPVGTVDVVPMVHQVNGVGDPTPHGTIHNVPYFRLQGGADAIILDPKVGDIGIAVFCSRDISSVKRSKGPANPGSSRKFDWADALYVGGVLNGVPNQYVAFSANGINILSPTHVEIQAPTIKLIGTTTVQGATTIQGNVDTTGTLTNNAHNVGSTHVHINGGGTGNSGPPL